MRETSTFGKIQDGVLRISRRNDFGESIKSLGDCRVLVIVKKLYKQRSTKTENGRGQNGYYWYIVVNLFCKGFKEAYEEPISMEKAHEILKVECNFTERVNLNTGVVLKQPQSTADLTTVSGAGHSLKSGLILMCRYQTNREK